VQVPLADVFNHKASVVGEEYVVIEEEQSESSEEGDEVEVVEVVSDNRHEFCTQAFVLLVSYLMCSNIYSCTRSDVELELKGGGVSVEGLWDGRCIYYMARCTIASYASNRHTLTPA